MILFFQLPSIAKALSPVEAPSVFANRISKERELLTSHGEAGRLFVSFVDYGDQHERFTTPTAIRTSSRWVLPCSLPFREFRPSITASESGLTGTIAADGKTGSHPE